MTQYIDKSTLVAEIEKRINKEIQSSATDSILGYSQGCVDSMRNVLSLIDTLEVKEVDWEKEFEKCCENYIFDDECEVYRAKHFFKLGLKAQKGE